MISPVQPLLEIVRLDNLVCKLNKYEFRFSYNGAEQKNKLENYCRQNSVCTDKIAVASAAASPPFLELNKGMKKSFICSKLSWPSVFFLDLHELFFLFLNNEPSLSPLALYFFKITELLWKCLQME